MTTLTLNEKLLTVLTAVKNKQALAVTETFFGIKEKDDWMKSLRHYFYDLPESLTSDLGLKRNERCIRAIEIFEIPNEWNETELDELKQFSFSY